MDNSYSIIFVQKTISILSKIVDGIESKKELTLDIKNFIYYLTILSHSNNTVYVKLGKPIPST